MRLSPLISHFCAIIVHFINRWFTQVEGKLCRLLVSHVSILILVLALFHPLLFLCVLVVLSCLPTDSPGWFKREQETPLSQFPSSFLFPLLFSVSLYTHLSSELVFLELSFFNFFFLLLLFFRFCRQKEKLSVNFFT